MLKKLWFACALILIPASALAQSTVTGIGPRVGFSTGPDQLVLGGQLVVGEVVPKLTFDPSLELGFGDNITLIQVNFDLHYHLTIQNSDWRPYFGAGVGIVFTSRDRPAPRSDDTATDVGGTFVAGVGVPTPAGNRFFTELRFGLADVPDLKLLAGWNFRL